MAVAQPLAISHQPSAMKTIRSSRLFARAQQVLPGGVDSPVRAFKAVGASPLFIRRASGAHIEDVDGNTFVDYVMSWGPLIHGHAPRALVKALAAAAKNGTSFGVTRAASADTLVAAYNDLDSVRRAFDANRDQIAAVIVEPIAGNMGVVPPADGFLRGLREICTANRAVLIFDEVISGFRASKGGAQALAGVKPDLTCLGKIIGGGLPVGAYGGRADLMDLVSPAGPVYQAGTLSGNPLAMTAGLWCLNNLSRKLYSSLAALGARLAAGLAAAARDAGVALQVNRSGSVLTPFFTDRPVRDFASATSADPERYAAFFRGMLSRGIYPPPSQFEAWFLSMAHTRRDVDKTIRAAKEAMREVARAGRAGKAGEAG